MIESPAPLAQLVAFSDAKRRASLTGRLLGLSLPERDTVLQEVFVQFEAALEAARDSAARSGQPVAFDGSAISLTDGGDRWIVYPDGRMGREYEHFPGFDAFLAQLADPPAVDSRRPAGRDALLEHAYHAFWSPSATNWQPMRVLELGGDRRDALARLAGWEAPTGDAPYWVLLRRDHYESLLGDVLEPFGLEVTAREESIDAGIFSQTLRLSAMASGLAMREHAFAPAERAEARALLLAELDERVAGLPVPAGAGGAIAQERQVLERLRAFLATDRYIPDALVLLGAPVSPVTPFPDFSRVIAEHSTQRVASPNAEFGHDAVMAIWEATKRTLPVGDRDLVLFADFSWHEQVPSRIGRAMFEALYGLGADPDTKAGGEGGILTAVTVANYLRHTAKTSPDFIAQHMPAGWEALDDSQLRKACSDLPVRERDLGRFLLERILRDGKYRSVDGLIQDEQGRPLGVPLLVRMMKSLAATFGNFFLKFQNTHPQNAVLLADTTGGELHHVYRTVGKAAAVLTYLSRAEGASSIIKTGPIDLARDPIGKILAENPDDLPHLRPWRDGLSAGVLLPAMTFQVGMPLAGSDVIEPGTPNEHTGYEERKRDKRPPREDFTWHYLPLV